MGRAFFLPLVAGVPVMTFPLNPLFVDRLRRARGLPEDAGPEAARVAER